VGAPLTDTAIQKLREMIIAGRYPSGAKLPPEAELAAELGLSRNTTREAVRALSTALVLDVRRGDGTYVTGAIILTVLIIARVTTGEAQA
jgi:GntR family transcriptional regulator, transcriptional repressor for pyruvate dehydrogenase complex